MKSLSGTESGYPMLHPDHKVFDAHFHIVDPRFPLVPNNGYLPDAFTCDSYLKRINGYNLVGGAVVSGSFQGFDQSYLLDALETLGPSFCGVTQIPADTPDDTIIRLNAGGVRAVRFNLKQSIFMPTVKVVCYEPH